MESFIICERSVITTKLMWRSYLVHNVVNCVMKLSLGLTLAEPRHY
jgi:hypothetical protein